MRQFVIRCRSTPVHAERFLRTVGRAGHSEYLAHILVAGLFLAKGHREDTSVHLVLEKSRDLPRVLSISGASLGSLAGLNESSILGALADALLAGAGRGSDAVSGAGIRCRALSFERLLGELAGAPILLDKDGPDVRESAVIVDPIFVMTDHTPMPAKVRKSMISRGIARVSVGPRTLHASQVVVLLHNEMDRRASFATSRIEE